MKKVFLQIEGMACPGCAARIEEILSKVKGVSNPVVNFTTGKASLEYDQSQISISEIIKVIEQAGYKAKEVKKGMASLLIWSGVYPPHNLDGAFSRFPQKAFFFFSF